MGFKKDGRVTAVTCSSSKQRALSPPGRSRDVGQPRVADVSGAEHALPRHLGGDQYAAGHLAARSGRPAGSVMFEPMIDEAARKLDVDRIAIRKINAPARQALFGLVPANSPPGRPRNKLTSCFVKECLDKGAEMFNWEERKKRSGQRQRQQGDRRGRGQRLLYRGIDRRRRALRHQARWQALHPPGHRQPRHPLGDRHRPRHRGAGRHAVGEVRGRLGRHEQGRGVELGAGRQPDHLRAHPRQLRGGAGAQAHPPGAGGGGDGRIARRLRRRQRARVPQGQPGPRDYRSRRRRSWPSSAVASSTATSCRRKSTR